MIRIRRSSERGHANHGWRDSFYTFSFADYHDAAHMGFHSLRVINEDTIAPGRGFGAHAHRDMEIITYVLDGALAHKDSMGENHIIGPNEIQAMSAGTGIVHSEFNGSEERPVHLLQIWIEPAMEDVHPSYQQISFDPAERHGKFRLLASPHPGADGASAAIHQDARVYAAEVDPSHTLPASIKTGRAAWIQVARGSMAVNGQALNQGDAAAIEGETDLVFTGNGQGGAEFLFFDLP